MNSAAMSDAVERIHSDVRDLCPLIKSHIVLFRALSDINSKFNVP